MITIIDYDAGNIKSIVNMLRALGVKSQISGVAEDIVNADKLILPGVGHYDHGMRKLAEHGLINAIKEAAQVKKTPLLGICLGAQLLLRGSEEGNQSGLNLIDGDTVAFDRSRMDGKLRVPHMGWADTEKLSDHALSDAFPNDARFYYVHSFHMKTDSPETAVLSAYHGYAFTAGIAKGNILGYQFHPEKSHKYGMGVLKAFSEWVPQ